MLPRSYITSNKWKRKIYIRNRWIHKELKLTEEKIRLAALIGLLHDIGRFEQYTKYNTFSDKLSADHADLGEKTLDNNDFIREFIRGKRRRNINF